jgi:hypothetical protein
MGRARAWDRQSAPPRHLLLLCRRAAGSRDATAIVWDPATAAPVQKLAGGHKYQLTGVGLLPGSGEIVTCALDK